MDELPELNRPAHDLLPAVLRAAEVAELFGVCLRTLRRWEGRGLLIPARVGRTLFYRTQDIELLVAARIQVNLAVGIGKKMSSEDTC